MRFSYIPSLLFVITHIAAALKPTVVITGANRGIGLAAVKKLIGTDSYNIVCLCRSKDRGEKALGGLPGVEVKEVDLSSLKSVKSFTDEWGKHPIDVLVCNAGIQLSGGSKVAPTRTEDGFEVTVGTNHIGHFVLVNNLLPVVKKRIVWVGSGVHNPDEAGGDVGSKATLGNMQGLEDGFRDPISMVDGDSYDPDKAYKDSKLCNVVTSIEFARRLSKKRTGVTSNVMNPGLIPTTGLFRDLNPIFVAIFTLLTRYVFKVAVSEEEGGRRLAYLISSPALAKITGAYFSGKPGADEFQPISPSVEASNTEVGAKLFTATAKICKAYLSNVLD